MERILACAKQHGYTEYTSTLIDAWHVSIAGINLTLGQAVDIFDATGLELSPDDTFDNDPISLFAIEQSRLHRERGVNLTMFLGLLKYYRQVYLDCVTELGDDSNQDRDLTFVNRFYDRLEIALCSDWTKVSNEKRIAELQERNRTMTNEKNKFLTLFESLLSPVFLVDAELHVDAMNRAAAKCLGMAKTPGELYYAERIASTAPQKKDAPPSSLHDLAPWLAAPLETALDKAQFLKKKQPEIRFKATMPPSLGSKHFDVSISNMADISDKFTGIAIILEDITRRIEAENQLATERNRANYYLNVVGTPIVGLDASGTVTLINETGCRVLGYAQQELLGQNWIDQVIPEEQRDEIRDYLQSIFIDNLEIETEHVNYVTTKEGEHLLIAWKSKLIKNEEDIPVGVLSSGVDITEQRAIEESMAERELWLRNTFVALGEGVLILTPEKTILDANPSAETMFGMSNEEFVDAPNEILHVDHNHYLEFEAMADKAFDRNETAHFEHVMRRKNGNTFPVEHTLSLITNDDGAPLGIVNVVRDISKRKKAELELKRSEEKFRSIFESIEEGYIVTDLNGRITMVNPAICKLLGYTEEELVDHDAKKLYAKQEERNEFRKAIKTKDSVQGFQLTALRKDGSTLIMEANARLVLDQNGLPVRMEGTFHDITHRIEAEKVIRESEKQYRAFFENNHAIMLLVEPQTGNIVDANPAASSFYGYSREDMRSMGIDQINALNETELYEEMALAHKEQRAYFLFRHILADGDIRDVEVYSGPIMVQDRQLLYSVIHDVTKRVLLEREMKQLATTDTLTGVNNRHQIFSLADAELRRSMRYKHPMTVFMLDIDYFKSINDTYGHQVGDVVLTALATMTISTLRETDLFGRIGGEEFVAVLPETGLKEGLQVAERLCEALSKLIVQAGENKISFTVSIGVTLAKRTDKTIEEVVNRADEALYKAKRMGRNRVVRG